MKVALLPTGRTEWQGLPRALAALFPGHDFHALPTIEEVRSHPDDFPSAGFTSSPLGERHETSPPEAASELVERAARAALGDRHVKAADMVVVLDDLELANVAQPDRVVRVFRAAVTKHLKGLGSGPIEARTRAALRERVSFHLFVPMVEALFFADPGALRNAGVPAGQPVAFASTCDPEAFLTTDAVYLQATEAACPRWSELPAGRKKKLRPKWLGTSSRDRHPKGYLQWLCRDGAEKSCTTYRETEDGGRALAGIDWSTLLSRPGEHVTYLRALLADIEERLGGPAVTGPVQGVQAAVTSRFSARPDAVLRNL